MEIFKWIYYKEGGKKNRFKKIKEVEEFISVNDGCSFGIASIFVMSREEISVFKILINSLLNSH